MTYKCKSIVLVLIAISFAHCLPVGEQESQEINRVRIDVDDFNDIGNLSEFLEITELIPLETNKKCLINRIDKVVVFGSKIFVFDKNSQRILLFNRDGTFISQIGMPGKGPGEYLEISDFEIDRVRNLVYVLDFQRVHTFSINGEFQRTTKTEFMAQNISVLNNNEVVFNGAGRDDRIFITDSTFKINQSFFPYTLAHRIAPNFSFSKFNENTIFHLPNCDTLYTFRDQQPYPFLYIDFNGKNFTNSDFEKLSDGEKNNLFDYLLKGGKYANCVGFLPVKNRLYMVVLYSGSAYWGFYNMDTNEYSFVSNKNIKNDIFGSFMYFNPTGATEDEYILAVPSYKIIGDNTTDFYLKHHNIIDLLSEESNPVLLLAKAKI